MDDFALASAISAVDLGARRFSWRVPDGWQQGKGAFGGLVLGALARAMAACEPEPLRRLRTLSGELCAPMLVGDAELTVEELRRGRGTTYLEARARQGGQVIARASGLFGVARPPAAARLTSAPPTLPPFAEVAAAPSRSPMPRFLEHFAFHPVGPLPFSGIAAPRLEGYLRGRSSGPAGATRPLDAAAVIGLLDAWWPCAMVAEPAPRAMATVTFLAELLVDPAALDAAAPLAYRAQLAGVAEGHTVELRELWQGETLVALNQQMFAAL